MKYNTHMKKILDIHGVDTELYQHFLKDFLPDQIIDVHTHVYLKDHLLVDASTDVRLARWPERVAQDNSYEDLKETNRLMFPDKRVQSVIFAYPMNLKDIDSANKYIATCCEVNDDCFGLLLSKPEWDDDFFEQQLVEGKFKGAKVYLNFAPPHIAKNDICIFDFLPHHQLAILNRHRSIVMLHIPRETRLKDPDNLSQIIEIEKKYPGVKLIIAHVGRAYCKEDIGNAFEVLDQTKNVLFDFCANTNQYVFEQLIKAVGPKRILYGSDLPITRMRMKRVCEEGNYINIIAKGSYGDVSDDSHMREIAGEESAQLSFFLYEEILAFMRAAKSTSLTDADIEDIFLHNARRILEI